MIHRYNAAIYRHSRRNPTGLSEFHYYIIANGPVKIFGNNSTHYGVADMPWFTPFVYQWPNRRPECAVDTLFCRLPGICTNIHRDILLPYLFSFPGIIFPEAVLALFVVSSTTFRNDQLHEAI